MILFKISQNKVTMCSYLSDLSLLSPTARAKQEFRSSLEYIYGRMVQRNDSVLTFDEGNTCYLYIAMPKRGCKKVSDVRTAISYPNRQLCFEEVDCNSCKILFAEREKPLSYDNRFDLVPMRVLSEKEQQLRLQQHANGGDISGERGEVEKEAEKSDDESEKEDNDDSAVNNGDATNSSRGDSIFNPLNRKLHPKYGLHPHYGQNSGKKEQQQKRKRPAVLSSSDESDGSDGEDTIIDGMFYNPNPTRVNGMQ